MNKIITFLATYLVLQVLFLRFDLVYALDIDIKSHVKNIINQSVNKLPVTFKDQNYTNPSNKFNGNETVFIKVASSATGTEQNEAWLLGSNKEKILKITLERNGSDPYVYLGETKLPNLSGQYYLSINIKGDNSSFSFEQNIEVINTSLESPSPVITKVETTKEASPSQKSPPSEEIKRQSIMTTLVNLISELILSIKSFLKIQP